MTKPSKPNLAVCKPRHDTELVLLRLAAIAIDVRGMLSPYEISEVPALDRALLALDDLFRERYQDAHKSRPESDPPR